ncbi:uncharacterized protein LOC115242720 [Formica exsecta]|uniref:uncharacterized protein LOC115242720 n=1 Tax=Formica exsecta TaxID=72781 RepID=UPI00114456F7|nr:uncharacterized protein LOC115242720 [Formica exsecta]
MKISTFRLCFVISLLYRTCRAKIKTLSLYKSNPSYRLSLSRIRSVQPLFRSGNLSPKMSSSTEIAKYAPWNRHYHENCPTKHRIPDPLIGRSIKFIPSALPLPRITKLAELPRRPCCGSTGREPLPPGIQSQTAQNAIIHPSKLHEISMIIPYDVYVTSINTSNGCRMEVRNAELWMSSRCL